VNRAKRIRDMVAEDALTPIALKSDEPLASAGVSQVERLNP